MADLKLLKEVKFLPKLSLATSPKEYYDWEDYREDFFWGGVVDSNWLYRCITQKRHLLEMF